MSLSGAPPAGWPGLYHFEIRETIPCPYRPRPITRTRGQDFPSQRMHFWFEVVRFNFCWWEKNHTLIKEEGVINLGRLLQKIGNKGVLLNRHSASIDCDVRQTAASKPFRIEETMRTRHLAVGRRHHRVGNWICDTSNWDTSALLWLDQR
ncbi:hypothetical protein BKA67DRAFT_539824 [Truncatella angustata]|uniref:Uncharacterized protein n=1 Tax=Truncatella angustata TaxID=152316 RepID=A0A9P8UDM6_9PEZI|nr:uncharacterized protein BKA67DRAFT_539824 [Truncatella angustata]KAH6647996.1 hypothetical protein BKA67DRAFT_539824 [Truncatella angustata]